MITRISNTASKSEIEKGTNIPFRYGHLYKSRKVINGQTESSLSIITSEPPQVIEFGIWGILPADYAGDWKRFQNVESTLTIDIATVDETHWLKTSFKDRRCVVLATGFYNFIIKDRKVHPVYSTHPSNKIIRMAGVYNLTEDGFKTCTILVKKTNNFHLKTSFAPYTPILLSPEQQSDWIGDATSVKNKLEILMQLPTVTFKHEIMDPINGGEKGKLEKSYTSEK